MNSLISHIEKPIIKLTGQVEQLSLNGGMLIDMATLTNKTLYTSPYMIVTDQEYTKHYYAGTQRIASKLGAGFGGALVDIDVNVETINADVETIALDLVALLERSNTCAQIESGNVIMPEPILPKVEELRYTSINNLESDMYFYHSDLPIAIGMGSSSWITDASGDVNQHIQYLAFGEDFIYQRNSSWNVPYTFSGKEKDAETGYSYFGARYYDSEGSIWLSVDPMADKYPSMSAYMYCAGNPVMIIDPNGMNTIKKDESINDALKQDATAANTKKTSFTYTLDYKLNESNIPFVETFRHLKGTFCEVQNTGSASDYQQGDDGAGYKVTLKIPNVSPWTRDYPTYATATGTGDSPSNLTYTSDHQYANAFFAGMTAGALTGLATELVGAALAGKGFVKPAGWVSKTSGNKKGILYRDPYNKHNAVRVMNGDPKSGSFPYVKYMKNGKFYNVNGKVLSSGNIPAAHIPLSKFNINVMPKF